MGNFLATFDLLKSPIIFLYKGKTSVSTHVGFAMSLILFILLLSSTLNSDFFYQKKPNIASQTDINESYGLSILSRENFTIAVKIADFSGVASVDFSYFYFIMSFNSFDSGKQLAHLNEDYMRFCQIEDFNSPDGVLNLAGKTFCPNQKIPLNLQGSLTSLSVDYAIIHVYRCDSRSAKYYNVTCKSKDEIDQFFQNKFLYLYYTDNTFDLTNRDNPVKRTLNVHLAYFYPKIKKTTMIPVQKTKIYTESGEFP